MVAGGSGAAGADGAAAAADRAFAIQRRGVAADVRAMLDKGYAHPLYCLDLLPASAEPEGGADFAVPVPEGQLVTAAVLRRRAAHVSTAACLGALQVVLAHHARAAEILGAHGLTAPWAAALAYWAAELRARERQREPLSERIADLLRQQQAALQSGRALWRRLRLIAELGGLGGQLAAGRPPRAELAFTDALAACGARLGDRETAARLRPFGLSPELVTEVQQLAEGLWARRRELAEAEASRARLSGAITVIRAALFGDVARLCRVAAVVLLPEQRAALRVERLFVASALDASAPAPI